MPREPPVTTAKPFAALPVIGGIVGAGVIGGGWALHYLRMGLHVDVHDPGPRARDGLLRMLESAWPVLERLGLRPGASPDRLTFCRTLGDAVGGADVVQENCPEDAALKRRVLADIDAAAPPEVVIASSTSGFAMTMLQADCANPQRCVVGHPFNPPYLIPLVEVAGGEKTDPAAVDWLTAFYASVGKRPLRLAGELPGCMMAMEACCGAHHLGRKLRDQGHQARLMSPEYVRPS